jgi:uncharacterized membrane protein SirB2
MLYPLMKSLHMILAIVTLAGFLLRGYWMMTESEYRQLRIARIAPHIVDTVFLLSGIALVFILHINAFAQPWLLAKFAGLIVYIVLGTFALKRGATRQVRIIAFVASLAVFAYVVGAAVTKSPTSWLGLFAS